ncbi:MAG: DUF2336 domain-containing protein [Pseudomonadota bacterium]
MSTTLTGEDVQKLLSDTSASGRASMIEKVASSYEDAELTDAERVIAEDIIRAMARDASEMVREALAANVKSSTQLPHDVAKSLAQDIDSVALPILEFSEVLTDADLVELVRSQGESKQVAIARRATVSSTVSDALIETDNVAVVGTLVGNKGATISDASLQTVVDKFGEIEAIQKPLTNRSTLPVTIAEQLVSKVSDSLKQVLMVKHELSGDTAADLVMRVRERATVRLAADQESDLSVEKLCFQLHRNGRLTPSLMLRAICTGDMIFFETGLAIMARVPVANSHALIMDPGGRGLKGLYLKAGMPVQWLPAVELAVQIVKETPVNGGDYDRDSYGRVVLERILTQCPDLHAEEEAYLLNKLDDMMHVSGQAA